MQHYAKVRYIMRRAISSILCQSCSGPSDDKWSLCVNQNNRSDIHHHYSTKWYINLCRLLYFRSRKQRHFCLRLARILSQLATDKTEILGAMMFFVLFLSLRLTSASEVFLAALWLDTVWSSSVPHSLKIMSRCSWVQCRAFSSCPPFSRAPATYLGIP